MQATYTKRFSYGWGLWHDSKKRHLKGVIKNIDEAKSEYYRTLELIKDGSIVKTEIYGNKTTADLKKWAIKHLNRLGGIEP